MSWVWWCISTIRACVGGRLEEQKSKTVFSHTESSRSAPGQNETISKRQSTLRAVLCQQPDVWCCFRLVGITSGLQDGRTGFHKVEIWQSTWPSRCSDLGRCFPELNLSALAAWVGWRFKSTTCVVMSRGPTVPCLLLLLQLSHSHLLFLLSSRGHGANCGDFIALLVKSVT